jgi:hypothetical protein
MTRRALQEVCDTGTSRSGLPRMLTGALQEVCDPRTSRRGRLRMARGAPREACNTRTSRSGAPRMTRGALREVRDARTSCSACLCEARADSGFLSAVRPARGRPRRASLGPSRPPARRRRASTGARLLLRRRRENPRGAPPPQGRPTVDPSFWRHVEQAIVGVQYGAPRFGSPSGVASQAR